MIWLNPALQLQSLALALVLELLLGEPRRWHPLVGFGRLARAIEQKLNTGPRGIALGSFSVLILLLIPCVVFVALQIGLMAWSHDAAPLLLVLLNGWALWFALGASSLLSHVKAIARPLQQGASGLPLARLALGRIVSRDCRWLTEGDVATAAVESTLENGSDAIFATLFWFALLGGAGAIVHRLANTLDAMWGYRNARFNEFGRCAARLDDVLNFIPARLTAASYALLGDTRNACKAWREQAPLWDSPNAGPVMAAGAGALQITLGGDAIYHGRIESRPILGYGKAASASDIARALALVQKTLLLWLLAYALLLIALQG